MSNSSSDFYQPDEHSGKPSSLDARVALRLLRESQKRSRTGDDERGEQKSADKASSKIDIKLNPKDLVKPKPASVEAIMADVEKVADAKVTRDERVKALKKALEKPGANNDDLIKAIFQSTAKCPVTDDKDPRLALLARIGYTHSDPRVEQAVAITLMRTKRQEAYCAGLWMLADVAARGGDQEAGECKAALKQKASFSDKEEKEIEAVKKDVLQRSKAALRTISDAFAGIGKQEKLTDNDAIKALVKRAEDAIKDEKLPGRLKVQALADAWAAGEVKDPTKTLLPLTRKLAFESKDEQVKAAALFLMLLANPILEKGDLAKVKAGIEQLADKASSEQIKEEAKYLLKVLNRK